MYTTKKSFLGSKNLGGRKTMTKKFKRKVISGSLAVIMLAIFAIQAHAAFGAWRTYSVPSRQTVVAHPVVGSSRVVRRTAALPVNATRRLARIEARNQTMWSNPEVRAQRITSTNWLSGWTTLPNNSHRDITIPVANAQDFVINVRSAPGQVGTDTLELRMNVQRN